MSQSLHSKSTKSTSKFYFAGIVGFKSQTFRLTAETRREIAFISVVAEKTILQQLIL